MGAYCKGSISGIEAPTVKLPSAVLDPSRGPTFRLSPSVEVFFKAPGCFVFLATLSSTRWDRFWFEEKKTTKKLVSTGEIWWRLYSMCFQVHSSQCPKFFYFFDTTTESQHSQKFSVPPYTHRGFIVLLRCCFIRFTFAKFLIIKYYFQPCRWLCP